MFNRVFSLLFLAPALLANGPSSDAAIEFDQDDRTVTITIDGRPTLFEVPPDGPGSPVVNSSVAEELGKKGGFVKGVHIVGRTPVRGSSNLARLNYGNGKAKKQRIFWFERDWAQSAEGRIGPSLLPNDIVVYRLGDQKSEERLITLPMIDRGRAGLRTEITVGDQTIPAIFTFDRSETMLTAAAGALLASENNGRMVGDVGEARLEMGFVRPVRQMEFSSPITLGRLELVDIVVRTQDTGSTSAIPDGNEDLNEIVVSAKSKRKPILGIFVGTASLAGCSSLTFDKARKEIRLSCI